MAPTKSYYAAYNGVHLKLSPYFFSIQIRSRSMVHHGSVGPVQNKIEEAYNHNPNPNP